MRTLAALERVATVPVWDDYLLSRHPLLLVADSSHRGSPATPVCAAVWRTGRLLELIELAALPRLSTPLYGMLSLDPAGARGHAGMSTALTTSEELDAGDLAHFRRLGLTRAVILPFPMDFGRLGALGAALRQARADGAMMLADLAVHESFHLQAQFPTWLDQRPTYAWPAWDRQPDRRELRERCYAGPPEISSALRAEHAALLAAFDALDSLEVPDGRERVLHHARQFVELRNARRGLLDSMTVAREGERISCALAEDLMELEEGATQWIGHATTVRAGMTTRKGKRGSYAQPQPDAFYQFGPLQLWVLDGLLGAESVRALTASLARSTGAEGETGGLFARFALVVR